MTYKTDIDLYLFRRARTAPKEEKWKWDWDRWDPVIPKIYFEGQNIREFKCPVCDAQKVYAYFIAVGISEPQTIERGRTVYYGDRWFGCHNCDVQVRDRGEFPDWVRDDDVQWANEGFKERALRKLAEFKSKD